MNARISTIASFFVLIFDTILGNVSAQRGQSNEANYFFSMILNLLYNHTIRFFAHDCHCGLDFDMLTFRYKFGCSLFDRYGMICICSL